jgi:tetratricopeptide (TPR) repeat protein
VSPVDFKLGLTHAAYHMYQGTDSFYYKNARIVKNRIGASYWGVTHEYLKTPEGSSYGLIEKTRAFINDVGDGGSKADKFERDIRLLLKGLEDYPNNDRYTFYLANSYRDHGDNDLAIEYYKKRIEIGGWQEEVWHSYYSIGKCYRAKGDMVNAIHWWMDAYQFYPKRIENLYEIISHYRQIGKNQLAYMFYIMALKQLLLNPNPDYLFLQRDVYDYKLDYEFSIIGYYCNIDNYDMSRICTKVLNCKSSEWNVVRNVLSNYKFYSKKLGNYKTESRLSNALQNIGKELVSSWTKGLKGDDTKGLKGDDTKGLKGDDTKGAELDSFVSSTPSMAIMGNELVVNVRYVNYRINANGGYENQDHISTKNVIARFDLDTMEKKSEDFMWYDTEMDNLYVGLEDVRLFYSESQCKLLYNANRGLGPHNLKVEHGLVFAQSDVDSSRTSLLQNGLVTMDGQKEVEKNWVMFEDATGNLKLVYGWHDLVIGNCVPIDGDSGYVFEKTHAIKTPPIFKYFRGSTNGILIGDEIWFICHVVSYEDRRYYYHVFFTLDATTYEVRRFTPLFTFDGDKVEYTLGFVYREDEQELERHSSENGTKFALSSDAKTDGEFWIGYSKMDNSTHYMSVKKSVVESIMM